MNLKAPKIARLAKYARGAYDPKPIARVNSVDAWVPEYWANESIAILQENMVMGNLVHRDFENILASSGDVVNTRKPNEFVMKRKATNDNITQQDAVATNIPVALNQHLHVSFLIRDREQALSFADLTQQFLSPAVLAIAQGVDKILLMQAPRFLRTDNNQAGGLGIDESIASIVDTGKNLNDNNAPLMGRNLVVGTKGHASLIKISDFINAEKVGDNGTALREASLGRKFGFNTFMCQNVAHPTASDVVTGAINNAAGYARGTTVITVDGFAAAIANNTWFKVAGDDVPHKITATVGGGTPTEFTFTPALKKAVADNAVVTVYDPWAVNLVAGYAAGWEKPIVIDGFTETPQTGQAFQTAAGDRYSVIEYDAATSSVLLDRPLAAALANNDVLFPLPIGDYNFAFTRGAIALVTRPMALPRQGSGAVGFVASFNGLSMRVVWAYDYEKQGMNVTVDMLCGVAVLEPLLGEVMLG